MATILETLENAEFNLRTKNRLLLKLGFEQLHNATMLLIKGYSLYDNIETVMQGHIQADTVLDKEA